MPNTLSDAEPIEGVMDFKNPSIVTESLRTKSESYLTIFLSLKKDLILEENAEYASLIETVQNFLEKNLPQKNQHLKIDHLTWESLKQYPKFSFTQRIKKYFDKTLGQLYKAIVFGRCFIFLIHCEQSLQDEHYFQNKHNQEQFAKLSKELSEEASKLSLFQYSVFSNALVEIQERILKQASCTKENATLSSLIQKQITFYDTHKGWLRRANIRSSYQSDVKKLVDLNVNDQTDEILIPLVLKIILSADLSKNSVSKQAFRPIIEMVKTKLGIYRFEIFNLFYDKNKTQPLTDTIIQLVPQLENSLGTYQLCKILSACNILTEKSLALIIANKKNVSEVMEIIEICKILRKNNVLTGSVFEALYSLDYDRPGKTLKQIQKFLQAKKSVHEKEVLLYFTNERILQISTDRSEQNLPHPNPKQLKTAYLQLANADIQDPETLQNYVNALTKHPHPLQLMEAIIKKGRLDYINLSEGPEPIDDYLLCHPNPIEYVEVVLLLEKRRQNGFSVDSLLTLHPYLMRSPRTVITAVLSTAYCVFNEVNFLSDPKKAILYKILNTKLNRTYGFSSMIKKIREITKRSFYNTLDNISLFACFAEEKRKSLYRADTHLLAFFAKFPLEMTTCFLTYRTSGMIGSYPKILQKNKLQRYQNEKMWLNEQVEYLIIKNFLANFATSHAIKISLCDNIYKKQCHLLFGLTTVYTQLLRQQVRILHNQRTILDVLSLPIVFSQMVGFLTNFHEKTIYAFLMQEKAIEVPGNVPLTHQAILDKEPGWKYARRKLLADHARLWRTQAKSFSVESKYDYEFSLLIINYNCREFASLLSLFQNQVSSGSVYQFPLIIENKTILLKVTPSKFDDIDKTFKWNVDPTKPNDLCSILTDESCSQLEEIQKKWPEIPIFTVKWLHSEEYSHSKIFNPCESHPHIQFDEKHHYSGYVPIGETVFVLIKALIRQVLVEKNLLSQAKAIQESQRVQNELLEQNAPIVSMQV